MSEQSMAIDADKIISIKATRINNTTSPEEKNHDSLHYTVTVPMKEIFKFKLEDNLRDYYGSDESIKNKTIVHKEIKASFEENRSRFIQMHSGFTVVCNKIVVPQSKEFGINEITLTNASLINGAQSQGILKEISKEYEGLYDDTNVRVEIIVEQNKEVVRDIAIARNTSNNVSVLSRMGANDHFQDLQTNMWDTFGKSKEFNIQISETDNALPTQTLLQVIKAFTPDDIEEHYPKLKKSAVTAYSSKAGVLSEFRKMMEDKKNFEEILDYYHSFAGLAWKEYISWKNDPEWIRFQKKFEKIGKLNENKSEIDMQWAIICPTLYGLKSFFVSENGKWKLKYPESFSKIDYMNRVIDLFKDADFGNGDLQTFAKDRSVYAELKLYTLKKLN